MNSMTYYQHETINDLEPEVYMSEERILRQMEEHRQDVVDLFYGTNIDLTWKAAEAMAKMWSCAFLNDYEYANVVADALKIGITDAYAVLRNITEYQETMKIRKF